MNMLCSSMHVWHPVKKPSTIDTRSVEGRVFLYICVIGMATGNEETECFRTVSHTVLPGPIWTARPRRRQRRNNRLSAAEPFITSHFTGRYERFGPISCITSLIFGRYARPAIVPQGMVRPDGPYYFKQAYTVI